MAVLGGSSALPSYHGHMLQHDYIIGLIQEFGVAVSAALREAFHARGAKQASESEQEVEQAIGQLIDLDPATAMALSPDSLVTMIDLSGVGESVAGYVAWTLDRLADVYEMHGDPLASVRRAQAAAVATQFGFDLSTCPEEFEDLERELGEKGVG